MGVLRVQTPLEIPIYLENNNKYNFMHNYVYLVNISQMSSIFSEIFFFKVKRCLEREEVYL